VGLFIFNITSLLGLVYGLRRARAGVGNQTAILNSSVAFAYIGCSFKAEFVKIKL